MNTLKDAPAGIPERSPAGSVPDLPDLSRLTIIVPTYNRRDSLRRCLVGLLACDAGDRAIHLRIVDDGSTDGTDQMVAELRRQYAGPFRISYDRQPNCGQSAARNRAIAAADTDVILFMDDDCLPDPGWIRAMAAADWSEGTAAVGGKIVAAEQDNVVSRYCCYIRFNDYPTGHDAVRFVNSANCAYRRRALQEVAGYERLLPRLVDQDLARRLKDRGYRLVYQPDALVAHYHRDTLRGLIRTFSARGYASVIRNCIWGEELPITRRRVAGQWLTLLRRTARRYLFLPFHAVRLARRGVALKDALPFAFLEVTLGAAAHYGQIRAFSRIFRGEQSIQRQGGALDGTPP